MLPSQAQAQARLENSQVRHILETSKTRRIFMNCQAHRRCFAIQEAAVIRHSINSQIQTDGIFMVNKMVGILSSLEDWVMEGRDPSKIGCES